MAIVNGNFDASALATVLTRSDAMWSDAMMQADFMANVDLWKAIRKEQNADVTILQDSDKDRAVRVHWINSCSEVASTCDGDDCDLAGAELGSDSATYAIGVCKSYKFTVDADKIRTGSYSLEDIVAKGFLKADKALSEAVAATGLAKIESFKGVNIVSDGIGTPNGVTTETDIAAADWNERLFAYLYRVGIVNGMNNSFILSGNNLFEDWIVTQASKGNADGKGADNLYKLIRTYFDLFNIDTLNTPDAKSYLINRGAIAFASKNRYSAVPVSYRSQDRYSIASRNMPGVRFDVYYTNRCVGESIFHDFMVKVRYDYFLNPTGCVDTRTGVLALNKT